jgi:hypothetical protein
MRIRTVAVPVCVVGALALVTIAAVRPDREDGAPDRREGARLRAHLDSVIGELRARDVSSLGSDQRHARTQLIGTLERYRDAGVFPHNHDFPAARVPYFRDEHGTLCAMAYLVAATGRGDIVEAVAARRNNAYIPELAADARLVAWLDSVGLTVAEAARIQPGYDFRPIVPVVEDRYPRGYVLPSLALGLPAFFTTVVNWHASREKRTDAVLAVGALSGAATAILGVAILAEERDGPIRNVGVADLTAGSAALIAVLRRSLRLARTDAPHPPVAAESRLTFDVVPTQHGDQISPTGRVRIRF